MTAINEFFAILGYQIYVFEQNLFIKYAPKETINQAAKNVINMLIEKPAFLIKLASKVASLYDKGAYL